MYKRPVGEKKMLREVDEKLRQKDGEKRIVPKYDWKVRRKAVIL